MSGGELAKVFPGLTAQLDPAPADWIVLALEPWGPEQGTPVASLLPPHYEGYARILHPAGGHRWERVAEAAGRQMHPAVQFTKVIPGPAAPHGYNQGLPHPQQGTLEAGTRAALVDVLLNHTATPELGWFCLWNGFGGLPHEVQRKYGVVRAQARTYILLSGPVSAAQSFRDGPQIWWPADRAWCVASEIDFDSTVVAGSGRLIDEILRHPRLEALRVTRQTRLDYAGDEINPAAMSADELDRLRQQL